MSCHVQVVAVSRTFSGPLGILDSNLEMLTEDPEAVGKWKTTAFQKQRQEIKQK